MFNKFVSIILPIYNEAASIKELHKIIINVLRTNNINFEIIAVDDGSTDNTYKILKTIKPIIIIRHAKNYGQTAALSTGIQKAKGNIIIPLDADLENDPREIPKFLAKLDEGYDVVSGWRKNRMDKPLKMVLSKCGNILQRAFSGMAIHHIVTFAHFL